MTVPKDIQFPEVEPRYVFERDCLAFPVRVDGKPVECLVTMEFLWANFGLRDPAEAAMRQVFQEHKTEIEDIARGHIENGWVDEEGRILLTTRFTRLKVSFVGKSQAVPAIAHVHQLLTEIIGPNAEAVNVTWEMKEDPIQPQMTLEIADPSGPYKGKLYLLPDAVDDPITLRMILAGIWGRVLRDRSHRLILKSG
jgi:hypothetical protein